MFRLTAASLVVLAIGAVPAHAADGDVDANAGTPKLTITRPVVTEQTTRPAALPVLYMSLAGLQAYDVYSTRQGIAGGARENNPLVASAAGATGGMIVMKAVSTGVTIIMAERLWPHNKAAAIITMVAANGVMAAVAAHNAQVLHGIR